MKCYVLIVIALLAMLPGKMLLAHDNATLDAMKAPNGGMLRMAGAYHVELVLQTNQASVYVSDHADKALAVKGSSAELTLLGPARQQVRLQPAGANLLRGNIPSLPPGTYQAVLRLRMAGQQEQLARFSGVRLK